MNAGEIFGLLGPNGSGKTTLISIIATLIEASKGDVKVFGETIHPQNLKPKYLIGVVPQEIVSHGFFTIEEILKFVSGYYGIDNNKEHIEYLLENLSLTEHRKKRVAQLSGGMKRRLLIAKALVHKPKLLLLDEPTAGVDIELRNSLWKFVRKLNQDGCSILLTTHYLEEAEQLCHRVGIINRGKVLRVGNTKEIINEFTDREIEIELTHSVDKVTSTHLISQSDTKLLFRVPAQMEFGELMVKIALDVRAVKDFKIREGRLEDAFLKVLGAEK
jgi:ABC-2 type transport system ATP-binding protein